MKATIPQQWKSLSLRQLLELKYLEPSDFDSRTDFFIQKVSIITGISDSEIDELTQDELFKFIAVTNFINTDPKNYPEKISFYDLKNFKDLTLGEFIDIETYIARGLENATTEILMTLYRRSTINEWGMRIFEPLLAIDFEKRKAEFENFTAEIYGAVVAYMNFRNDFINRRKALFGIEEDEDEEEELDEDEKDDKEELIKKHSWKLFLYNLAKGDITKIDAITDLNLFLVYGMVAMKYELKLD